MRGDQFAELGEGPVHILLPPSLPAIGEDAPYDFGVGTWRAGGQGLEEGFGELPSHLLWWGRKKNHPLGNLGNLECLLSFSLENSLLILQSPPF